MAKTFSPDEMNNVRQAYKMLGYFKEAEKLSTVGSDTAAKMVDPNLAAYPLERRLKNIDTAKYSTNLRWLSAAANAARESAPDERNQQ